MVNPYEAPNPSDPGVESDFSWRSSVVRCLSSYLLLVMSATVFVAGFSLAFVGVATQLHILMSLFGVGMCVLGLAGMLVAWRTSNRGALANGVVQLTDWPNEGATWGGENSGKTGLAWIGDICSIGDRIFVAAWQRSCFEED